MTNPTGLASVPSAFAAFDNPAHRGTGGETSAMSDLLQLMGAAVGDAQAAAELPVPVRRLREGDTLYGENARAEAFYFVRAGTFKTYRTGEDGYEQVLGFAGRGEALGFDAIGMGHYTNEAVALEDSSVYVILLRDYFTQSPRNAALDQVVFRAISHALMRRGELADVMAAVAAEVRLARFLMHLSQQIQVCGQSRHHFHLRMSRRDIASYLGVAHETISRSFSSLAAWGLVSVDNREVEILDMEKLKAFSSSTRRSVDEVSRSFGASAAQHSRAAMGAARRGSVAAQAIH